ncbi:hypothetical protein EST38_g5243 [Candolleomyces aberdarensis]|uniref:Uncharacterized protein n=1 Tax=Candolleomyces aberdarensis TaxID=2316362 RepID=A0A4Q2DNV4_9AGAR|nr:hypothetical protein EST38_g5243 [Candolleomyces aberdarensis]
MDKPYGRNRQSIADIEESLYSIFDSHPKSHPNPDGEPVIPADALVDVLKSFSNAFNGVPLLSDEEQSMLEELLRNNSGLEVSPGILLQFIAQKTAASPSPPDSPPTDGMQLPDRGRSDDRDMDHSRSPSTDSNNAYSRPPSRGPPQTPGSGKSPFDAERRQRSTPLTAAGPPSSWSKRPTPARRRKSDAGSRSDSEYGPTSFNRSASGRGRLSNPTSPAMSSFELSGSFSPVSSPPPSTGRYSRPPSRQNSFGAMHLDDLGYISPDDNTMTVHNKRLSLGSSGGLNTVPLPRDPNDSDEEEDVLGLVTGRSIRESDASMDDFARLEALQRQNEELHKKRVEYEEVLNKKIAEHEHDYAELEGVLDQMKVELSATKREEKELRAKERQNTQQISGLEQEIVKLTNSLSQSRSTYNSLQKQYQEQCAYSEKFRNDLLDKEDRVRSLEESYQASEEERDKLEKERQTYEERIAHLEHELNIAATTFAALDEQKQENLLLKETIDRMRYDIDEMRNSATNNTVGSGQSSAANSISKSLGVELAGKMKWDEDEEDVDAETSNESILLESEEETEGEEEDVIQTIITRKKRKVASRAAIEAIQQRVFEEVKDYSDTGTQYDPTYFAVSRSSQTEEPPKILTASHSIQTEQEPVPEVREPPPKAMAEMEIQTEVVEEEPSRSPSPQQMESLASSSSTVVPATPKAFPRNLDDIDPTTLPLDQPPAYSPHDHDWNTVAGVLKKWHAGVKMPVEGVPGGISEEAVEEWKALKEELGVGCVVIDKLVEASEKTPQSRKGKASASSSSPNPGAPGSKRNRFYNIYNTYVYGDKNSSSVLGSVVGQAMMVVGASALVMLAIGPYVAPPHYSIPGGVTYYDRAAWSSFNGLQAAGEGFSTDGTAAVWDFLGRVGGGAARMARGWPT